MLRFLFPARLRQWLGPAIVAGLVAALFAAIVVQAGWIDLSAAKPHPDGWARILHYTFVRSTAHHADAKPPADLESPVRIAAGAAYYGQVCAHCHGGPGMGQNPIVLSMHPRPQYLAQDLRQPDARFSDAELFRIVRAGVKYSAMPSWPADGRDDEVWHLVAFLKALPTMSPETFRSLAIVAHGPATPGGVGPAGRAPQRRYALRNDREPPRASFAYRYPAFGFSGFAQAADPIATCARCHGADGAGGGAFPNLTLQDRSYLARTLTAFADGSRDSGFMRMVASELTPQQIAAFADHYAGMPRRSTDPSGVAAPELGERLALVGDKALGLGPCAGCHGVTRAAAKSYPQLEGQSRWYVANQMRLFKAGGRGGIEGENPMPAIAARLDDRAIEAVAAYYAARPPAVTQSFAAAPPTR